MPDAFNFLTEAVCSNIFGVKDVGVAHSSYREKLKSKQGHQVANEIEIFSNKYASVDIISKTPVLGCGNISWWSYKTK